MISEGLLIAERALAQHSQALHAPRASGCDLLAVLAEAVPRIAETLATELLELTGGARPQVTIAKPETANAAKLHKSVAPVAVNMLLGERGAGQWLASLDFAAALMLTDQVFGGSGAVPGSIPERLPAAAEQSVARLAGLLGQALARAFEREEPLLPGRRDVVLGRLLPARDEEAQLLLRCEVAIGGAEPWKLLLAVRESELQRLAAGGEATGARAAPGDRRRPDAAPFAQVPLVLAVPLAEITLPVSRVAALRPGDLLPLVLRGEAPLRLAGVELARGLIGTHGSAMALRLTTISWNEKDQNNDR